MKIRLGNFTYWRIKRVLLLLGCMFCSIVLMYLIKQDILLIIGLIMYGCLEELPFVKNNFYEAEFLDEKDVIKVNLKKKSYFIKKNKIDYIELKEVRYGGRWLDIIGYRLIVIAEQKFLYDFVFEDTDIEKEKQQILDLKKLFDKAKITMER